MPDWVDIRFKIKLTLVDEAFLTRMDACFAKVGYRPTDAFITGLPAGQYRVDRSDRLTAMDRVEFHDSFRSRNRLTSAAFGYLRSGANDDTTVHIDLFIWETYRYVFYFDLKTHADSSEFTHPDDGLDLPPDEREAYRISVERAAMSRQVAPIIHQEFGAYYSEAMRSHGEDPVFFTGREYNLPFFDGKTTEAVKLYQAQDGKWICPVCHESTLEQPPWFLSSNPQTPWAEPSLQRCPICHTQFGSDDNLLAGTEDCQDGQWTLWWRLQRKWLKHRDEAQKSRRIP